MKYEELKFLGLMALGGIVLGGLVYGIIHVLTLLLVLLVG